MASSWLPATASCLLQTASGRYQQAQVSFGWLGLAQLLQSCQLVLEQECILTSCLDLVKNLGALQPSLCWQPPVLGNTEHASAMHMIDLGSLPLHTLDKPKVHQPKQQAHRLPEAAGHRTRV